MDIEFTIPGSPKGKARHRTTKTGINYTPKETTQYENLVRMMFKQRYTGAPCNGLVTALIVACFPIPKATTIKNRSLMNERRLKPQKKPDCDNIAKIILDSLNQIAYRDDSQVCGLTVFKVYDKTPRVIVSLGLED